ncbi:UvrD-helicase domain-containing protein [Pseudoxanthomonas sp. CF125]|uniref:UvrD-helicase domain-containing protein n=1 Tax=Pseudoxanthomonas sp. CF125 TaxID=1855303 RepID=UPI0008825E1C|nr:UvrD-helicase domain-containing protein [Pseudoxanthomonas sp. CF125]SDQ24731.1 Part of AAA domain-containing protein [Pseudoxanthomonas sp. CF125]
MDTSWWRKEDDLDDDQKAFILLPAVGRLMLEGPPGSGKTNLLLLRAQFIAGEGEKNVLIVTYTKSLADFMRSGVAGKGLIEGDQVRTFHSWANEHIRMYLGVQLVADGADFNEETRAQALKLLREANTKLPSTKLFSGIFVDEAQDFSADELECLLILSDKICVCGDIRQGLYRKDGLAIADRMGLDRCTLKKHYRTGQRIAEVADRILAPATGEQALAATANYDETIFGKPSARLHVLPDRDAQFKKMYELITVQLDAFKDDAIGILCVRKTTPMEVYEQFVGTPLEDKVCVHGAGGTFGGERNIHIMTVNAAKGAEFRAVHLYGSEDFKKFPMNRRELAYTAVTRAKTALNAYRTGPTSSVIESAFAEPTHMNLKKLFSVTP